ncbi:hypothetical protein [Cumulibacter manganitolerans]|uniref:hypothetical protein n=1 Tax=Cumulibacter manganitolerans TaxID=1884992 RepID=UPI0012965C49|nr:hypothetical protein [Cumulibacter manganitolerans]
MSSVPGSAQHAAGSSTSTVAPSSDGLQGMKKQCAVALSTAKGFLNSWKALASSGTVPTADERDTLAGEVQGYIDQLNAQLPTLTDTTLISHVQAIVAEMTKIVEGLQSGIAVELTSYRTAVNSATAYCK